MVDALQRIRASLKSGGLLIDTQPVSPHPPVAVSGSRLGRLDMREWLRTVEAVDALVARAVQAGVYSLEDEQRFIVTDSWDIGPECAETVAGWQGTRLSSALARRIAAAVAPVTIDQEVRLRLLRAH